jgi:hypothetical protein
VFLAYLPDYFTVPDEKNKDLYDLYKNNIAGGPSIVFHRYHKKDKIFILKHIDVAILVKLKHFVDGFQHGFDVFVVPCHELFHGLHVVVLPYSLAQLVVFGRDIFVFQSTVEGFVRWKLADQDLEEYKDDDEREREEKKHHLYQLKQQLEQYLQELPVVGFNTGKYDVNAMKVLISVKCCKQDSTVSLVSPSVTKQMGSV